MSFNFGTTPAPAATTAPNQTFSFGGAPAQQTLTFGAKPTQTALNLTTSTATTNPSGFTIGGQSTAPATSGFSFGGQTTSSQTAKTTAAQTSLLSAAITANPAKTSVTSSTTTGGLTSVLPTTQSVSQVNTSSISFNDLEESINKWTLDLEEQEKIFMNQAMQLNAWDKLLIANGDKVLQLNAAVEQVKQGQDQLDHELDFIVGQQRELEECLVPLEKEMSGVTSTDPERQHTYQLAENIDSQLKQMSEDLKEVIEHLNETNKSEESNDPIVQIGKILNSHMTALQWIDRNTSAICNHLDQIDKLHEVHRREHEKSFHLSYD